MLEAQNLLLLWYANNGRHDLPWRNTENIYHIYLSEIMLQQTQVSRVQEQYYPQFLEKYPTLKLLAEAPLEDILASWSGLGYYSRARNLHKTAQLCSEGLPSTCNELLQLPGIGRYTASAICSFGYRDTIAVVDTNIARVIKRFFALKLPKDDLIWSRAKSFVNSEDPRSHNLALMDLGSIVCLPKNPHCSNCPLLKQCQGSNNPELYTETKKKQYERLELFYGILIQNNQIALIQATGSMYKKMLELPSVDPIDEYFIGAFNHTYTKYRLTVNLYEVQETIDEVVWVDLRKIESAPISSLTKKALKIAMTR